MNNNPYKSVIWSVCLFLLVNTSVDATQETVSSNNLASVDAVLHLTKSCSPSIRIRSQSLSEDKLQQTCLQLTEQENYFHQLFDRKGQPVKHDNNTQLTVNVYQNRAAYETFGTHHFGMPTDNGGMYLEGLPDHKDNQAQFITYMRGDVIWNLRHEYVHYLDGRFNIYGDFCASLHDSHSPPENCPKPAPLYPHTVWWSEGVAEYVAKRDDHPRAFESVSNAETRYQLSELFNTSYEHNGGGDRVYSWGYFAVRFMMESHRDKIDEMLIFLRSGDFIRYQALVKHWGTSMDDEFNLWLSTLIQRN